MTRIIALCLLPLFCLMCGRASATGIEHVIVVVSASDGAHAEVVSVLRSRLLGAHPNVRISQQEASAISLEALAGSRVIVTVGSQAARIVASLAPGQTVVHTLIPSATYHNLPTPPRGIGNWSAILLDQPAERQIALLRLALPEWRRVALLSGRGGDPRVSSLADAARAQQLEVRESVVGSDRELYPALQQVLMEPAVLIATPDPQIFSSLTIQNVLLTAYRNRSPVLGFTAAYVRAGALLSLYSTPAQIGQQASELVAQALQGNVLPPVQSPQRFEVAINANVARSLGIQLDSAEDLAAALARQEGARR